MPCKSCPAGKIFVFGSNLVGRHGRGAARHAVVYHHAVYGVGFGFQGESFAIPTKGRQLQVLPLGQISQHVRLFLEFAQSNPASQFYVTRVGCGLAGYTDLQIAPMFHDAPENCQLPDGWRDIR